VRYALTEDGFEIALQPIVNARTNHAIGAEVLLRLNDPELGAIAPSEFIPVAEEAGLMEQLGDWVLNESCRVLKLMPPEMYVSVNLSPAQFVRGDIVDSVAKAIERTGANPKRIELEITEGLLLKDSPDVQQKIKQLKALNCTLALDDFGAGYSSLNYLWRYPFDKIKIDREFTNGMQANAKVTGIVKTMIQLATVLEMKVTAEGVETEEQAAGLTALGCDALQGYFYSRPLAPADFSAFLLRNLADSARPHTAKLKIVSTN
jgi:EAL domain-containing protein (putative c-di-GMP-specific phosphodiesterase class I)